MVSVLSTFSSAALAARERSAARATTAIANVSLAYFGTFPSLLAFERACYAKRRRLTTKPKPPKAEWMDHSSTFVVIARIAAALLIGGVIGFEGTFHGRPPGFRTHALVCIASAVLMLVTVYQADWMTAAPPDTIRTDLTRMAQGIMTGIGCLGAGVIFKEGLTVRGLTTAASSWVTVAIGILVG